MKLLKILNILLLIIFFSRSGQCYELSELSEVEKKVVNISLKFDKSTILSDSFNERDLEAFANKAILGYKNITRKHPNCSLAYINMAHVYSYKKDYKRAEKYLRKALKLEAGKTSKSLSLRKISYDHLAYRYKDEIQDLLINKKYNKAFALVPQVINIYEEAKKDFSMRLEQTPKLADKIEDTIKFFEKAKKEFITRMDKERKSIRKEAKEDKEFEKFMKVNSWWKAIFKAKKKVEKGNYESAIKCLKEFEKSSADFPVYYEIGRIYKEWEKFPEAIKMFKKQISIQPAHFGSYYELINYYFYTKKYSKVKKEGMKILKYKPKDEFDRYLQKRIKDYLKKVEDKKQ